MRQFLVILGVAIASPLILGGYKVNWPIITTLRNIMRKLDVYGNRRLNSIISFYTLWLTLALVGLISTTIALILAIITPPSSLGIVGLWTFLAGAVGWAATADSPLSIAMTSIGATIWACGTTDTPQWIVGISALYHIVVDAALYMAYISPELRYRKFGAWQIWLACLHIAFAATIMESESVYVPTVHTYAVWVENLDGRRSMQEVVKSMGRLNLTLFLPMCSWISGLHHAITYVGIFNNNAFVTRQISDTSGNIMRIIDWMFSASIMFTVNMALFHKQLEIDELIYAFSAFALIIYSGYYIDSFSTHRLHTWLTFNVASLAFFVVWFPTIYSMILATVDVDLAEDLQQRKPPLAVYFFWGFLILSFNTFPIVAIVKLTTSSRTTIYYESVYGMLSATSKIILLSIFYGGIAARPQDGEDSNDNQLYRSIAVGCSLGIGTAVVMGIHLLNRSAESLDRNMNDDVF